MIGSGKLPPVGEALTYKNMLSLVTTCEGIEEDSEVDALDAGLKRVVGGSEGRGLVSCS